MAPALRELTGPPEHWLTTLGKGFWGLTVEHKEQWIKLTPGDIMVLHATGPWKGHDQGAMPRGIIGIGIVGGTGEGQGSHGLSLPARTDRRSGCGF